MSTLDLVVLADVHYAGAQADALPLPERNGALALEFAVRALRDALRHGRPDAVVLMGDLVERGSAPGAMGDLQSLRDALARFQLPILAVPGNHDDYPDKVADVFGCAPGIHELNGYRLVIFSDRYDDSDVCSRPPGAMEVLGRAGEGGSPVIALQHNPLLPRITDPYPYTISGAEELAAAYGRAGVCLSVSGHYHAGLPPFERDGVTFVICPALCQAPFRYTRIRLDGAHVASVETVPLAPPELSLLFDAHMHTEFAYCAEDTTIELALERLGVLGIPSAGFCEHADQLYFPREAFWTRTDANELGAMRQAVSDGHARHARYRERTRAFRSDRVFLGLEVEPEASGRGLASLGEDLEGYDYLIGSVHYVTERGEQDAMLSQAEAVRRFTARTEQAVKSGIDILGHPFRYFPKHKRPVPTELFRPVAELLAVHGVAAEVNFHGDDPSPDFFALCLGRGVCIAVGTDAHSLVEVADLRPHLELLGAIGALDRLDDVMYRPARAGGRAR